MISAIDGRLKPNPLAVLFTGAWCPRLFALIEKGDYRVKTPSWLSCGRGVEPGKYTYLEQTAPTGRGLDWRKRVVTGPSLWEGGSFTMQLLRSFT